MIVYLITNKINGKRYVGKTSRTLEVRWEEHQRFSRRDKSGFYISSSMRKHGAENFEVRTIEVCDTVEALDEAEKRWIAELGTFGPGGYNLTTGGEGTPGRVTSEKTKKLLSEIAKKRPPASEEHRRRISEANSGENNAFFGKDWGRKGPLSEEAKRKLAIAHTGKRLSEDQRAKISKGCKGLPGPNKGKKFDNVTKMRMALARKFPVEVFENGVHICTCFSADDACKLFKPSNMSIREMQRAIKDGRKIGFFSFSRQKKCIAVLKIELEKV